MNQQMDMKIITSHGRCGWEVGITWGITIQDGITKKRKLGERSQNDINTHVVERNYTYLNAQDIAYKQLLTFNLSLAILKFETRAEKAI